MSMESMEEKHDLNRARELLGDRFIEIEIADIFSYMRPAQSTDALATLEKDLKEVSDSEKHKVREAWIERLKVETRR